VVVLLAQHGDFAGIDQLIERQSGKPDAGFDGALMTAIALSQETKYVPVVRRLMESRTEEWELRELLKALRGMTGTDARQVRLEINRRIRQAQGSAGGMIID
jgi:hypothetical protein